MDLPKRIGIEFIEQLFERFADQRFTFRRDDAGVFGVGLEIENIINGDEFNGVTERRLNPFNAFGAAFF